MCLCAAAAVWICDELSKDDSYSNFNQLHSHELHALLLLPAAAAPPQRSLLVAT
jgi:hypothetical protein